MRNKIAYAAGLLGMAALGLWVGIRRRRPGADPAFRADLPQIDDDAAANLIMLYRPALERALLPQGNGGGA
jgi:hypothetical protein